MWARGWQAGHWWGGQGCSGVGSLGHSDTGVMTEKVKTGTETTGFLSVGPCPTAGNGPLSIRGGPLE